MGSGVALCPDAGADEVGLEIAVVDDAQVDVVWLNCLVEHSRVLMLPEERSAVRDSLRLPVFL